MEVLLANPRGFCAGVERAIGIVERALQIHGAPIYVRHEVVHNKYVVDDLRKKGAVFVEELAEVPGGSTVIFSAHGVSKAVRAEAEARGLRVFDATCPLVTKVHVEVAKMREAGREIVMIGHRGHPEVEGTMGQSPQGMYLVEAANDVARLDVRDPTKLSYVTQTTLSVDDAAAIVGGAEGTLSRDHRAEEGRHLLRHAEPPGRGEVHGAPVRSGDRRRLAQQLQFQPAARGRNEPRHRRAHGGQRRAAQGRVARRQDAHRGHRRRIRPEVLVQEVIAKLRELGATRVTALKGIEENVVFPLPRGLGVAA